MVEDLVGGSLDELNETECLDLVITFHALSQSSLQHRQLLPSVACLQK